MADKTTILQNAQRYTAKGQIDKAIDEWQKLISESPNDGNIYNTIGDLYLKKNNLSQATEAYLKGATVFHNAGFALKAIAVYKKLIKLVPQRIDIQIKLADLNAERGLASNAIQDYLSAAKQYSQEGRIRETLEVYRKIANLDPTNTNVRLKLADMCLKEGLKQEAIDEYLKLAEFYQQNNQLKEAEAVQQHILKLNPNIKKATPEIKEKTEPSQETPSQAQRFSQIDGLIEKGDYDKARKLLTPFIEEAPEDPAGHQRLGTVLLKTGNTEEAFRSLKSAAQLYLSRSEYGQAGKLMKYYLETDPDRVEAHTLLGEIYEKGGNPHLAVSAYAHVIDEYLASGEPTLARDLYGKIKALEPQHRDVRRLRHSFEATEVSQPHIVRPDTGPPPETTVEPSPEPAPEPIQEPAAAEASPPPTEPAVLVDPAALQSFFTEADVYLKYGLSVKAIEQLQQVLALDPENVTAHEQLKNIYKSEGQNDKAVEECLQLMAIYKKLGDAERRMAALEEAKTLDPENPRVREASDLAPILDSGRLEALLVDEPAKSKSDSPSVVLDLVPDRIEPAGAAALKSGAAPPVEPKAETSSGSIREAEGEQEDVAERMAEADFYYQQGLRDEAKRMYELILALQPNHAAAVEKLETIAAEEKLEKETKAKRALEETEPTFEAKEEPPAAPPRAAKQKSPEELTLDEELERSFSSFMMSDAEEEVETREETGKHISEEAINPDKPKQKAAKKEPEPEEASEEYVDISSILNDDLREQPETPGKENISQQLDSLFSEFQKDAKEQVEDIDFETHYNLGIAYKEMGLLNEAILEFQQAIHGPDRYIDASSMLAACHQENGDHQEAMKLLKKALSDPRCDEAQGRWLRYDLASLYEKKERLEEALTIFNEIYQSDRKFKDVAQRIQDLQAALGKPKQKIETSSEDTGEDEDVDAMMDRIFGETSSAGKTEGSKGDVRDRSKSETKKKDRISYL